MDCVVSGWFFGDECDTGGGKPEASEVPPQDLCGRMRAFAVFSDFSVRIGDLAGGNAAFYVL